MGKSQLSTLIEKLESIGNSKEEIYGVIINLGINRGLKNKVGYDYTSMLAGTAKIEELDLSKEDTEVSRETLFNISDLEQNKLKKSLIKMGIDKEFLEEKDIKNIYVANEIVEGYNWNEVIGRKLEEKEKTAIMKNILGNSCLERKKAVYLSTLIEKLATKEKNKEEVYGVIINLGINNGLKNKVGYGYSSMLNGKSKIEELELSKEDTEVTEETIEKAKTKAAKLMKKTLAKTKEKKKLSEMSATLDGIKALAKDTEKETQQSISE